MVQQQSLKGGLPRRHTEPPQLWLAVLAGSLVLHSGLFVGIRWLTGQIFAPPPNSTPIAIELLDPPTPAPSIGKATTPPLVRPSPPTVAPPSPPTIAPSPQPSPDSAVPSRPQPSATTPAPPQPRPQSSTPPQPRPSTQPSTPVPPPPPSSGQPEDNAEGGPPIGSGVPLTTQVAAQIDPAQLQLQPQSAGELGSVTSASLVANFPTQIPVGFRAGLKSGQVLRLKVAFAVDHLTERLLEDSLRVTSEPIDGLSQADLQAIAEKVLSEAKFQATIETSAAREAEVSAWEGTLEIRVF